MVEQRIESPVEHIINYFAKAAENVVLLVKSAFRLGLGLGGLEKRTRTEHSLGRHRDEHNRLLESPGKLHRSNNPHYSPGRESGNYF